MSDIKSIGGRQLADVTARKTVDKVNKAFSIKPLVLTNNDIHEIVDGVTYYRNPYRMYVQNNPVDGTGPGGSTEIHIYDADMNELINNTQTWNNHIRTVYWQGKTRPFITVTAYITVEGNTVTAKSPYQTTAIVEMESTPKYISFGDAWTVGRYADILDPNMQEVTYNEEQNTGLLEQINAYNNSNLINSFDSSEIGRFLSNRTIHTTNAMRHALRIASYNIYGAMRVAKNWQAVKEHVQRYGIDIIGMQEVKHDTSVVDNFPEAMRSWDMSTITTTQTTYGTATLATDRFAVASFEEHDYTTNSREIRKWTKTELYLPMFKHRFWSDHLKISVYNTQWEVNNRTVTLAQARELATAMQTDTNPFVMMVADTNDDYSFEREAWQIMADAGFRPLFSIEDSATLAEGRDPVDNIFVNDLIQMISNDVISGANLKFTTDGGASYSLVTDHDLIFADVTLDYDDIIVVKKRATNCTITGLGNEDDCFWFKRNSGIITVTISPDEGYQIGSTSLTIFDITAVTNKQIYGGNTTYPAGIITVSGNTVTIDTSNVHGDMAFYCDCVAV